MIKVLSAIGALAGVTAIWWWKRNYRNFKLVGTVSRIYIYPVKSCKGIRLTEAECLKTGMHIPEMRDR